MRPVYVAFVDRMMERRRSQMRNGGPPRGVLARHRCQDWTTCMCIEFPHLKQARGFVRQATTTGFDEDRPGIEHFWCVDQDGSIVDPTIEQFTPDIHGVDSLVYTELDPEKHRVVLGPCANCGSDIYGKITETYEGFCNEECQEELAAYYDKQ